MDCQDLMMHFIKVVIHQSNGLDQFVYHQVHNLYLGGRKLIDKEELKLLLEMLSESERIDSIMVSRCGRTHFLFFDTLLNHTV